MHKKLFALILAFILLSSLALPGSAAVPDELLASDASLPLSEEKAYCNATLEDEFADDRVVVVLSNKASTSLRTYTTADFEGIGLEYRTRACAKTPSFSALNSINVIVCGTDNIPFRIVECNLHFSRKRRFLIVAYNPFHVHVVVFIFLVIHR